MCMYTVCGADGRVGAVRNTRAQLHTAVAETVHSSCSCTYYEGYLCGPGGAGRLVSENVCWCKVGWCGVYQYLLLAHASQVQAVTLSLGPPVVPAFA